MYQIRATLAALVALSWLALCASNGGVAVWQKANTQVVGGLRPDVWCTYFTGTSFFTRGYINPAAREKGNWSLSCPFYQSN